MSLDIQVTCHIKGDSYSGESQETSSRRINVRTGWVPNRSWANGLHNSDEESSYSSQSQQRLLTVAEEENKRGCWSSID